MLFTIQIFAGIAIGLALGFLILFLRKPPERNEKLETEVFSNQNKEEPFIDIHMDILLTTERRDASGVPELKEKLRQFKERNRFYNLQ